MLLLKNYCLTKLEIAFCSWSYLKKKIWKFDKEINKWEKPDIVKHLKQ